MTARPHNIFPSLFSFPSFLDLRRAPGPSARGRAPLPPCGAEGKIKLSKTAPALIQGGGGLVPLCQGADAYAIFFLISERRFSASYSVSSFLAKWTRTMLLMPASLKKEVPGTQATPTFSVISTQKSTSLWPLFM